MKKTFQTLLFSILLIASCFAINQNSEGVCIDEVDDDTPVNFFDCRKGFSYATFNRYQNVNFIGIDSTEGANLESEKDYFLSFRKFTKKDERNIENYEEFNILNDPAQENFKKFNDRSLNGSLEKDDIIEFQLYLHNNGSADCNVDPSICDNRFTYAIDADVKFTNNFENNTFRDLSVNLKYKRPSKNNPNNLKTIDFTRGSISSNLLKANQKFELLSQSDITEDALYQGVTKTTCIIDERNNCIDGETIIETQDFLQAFFTEGVILETLNPELPEGAFAASMGNAVYINFFAKVVEEDVPGANLCNGEIDINLQRNEDSTPKLELVDGKLQGFFNITTPERFTLKTPANQGVTNIAGRGSLIETSDFNREINFEVNEDSAPNQCQNTLKFPKCKGLKILNSNFDLDKGNAQILIEQETEIDDDQLKNYGRNENEAKQNIQRAFNQGLRFNLTDRFGRIKATGQGNNILPGAFTPKSTYPLFINQTEDFEGSENAIENAIGEIFQGINNEFGMSAKIEACDILKVECLNFEENCKAQTQFAPPTCSESNAKSFLKDGDENVIELTFEPNLKIYHEKLVVTKQRGSFEFTKTFDEENLKTTIRLSNFDEEDEVRYFVPTLNICNTIPDFSEIEFIPLNTRSFGSNVLNPSNISQNGIDLDVLRSRIQSGFRLPTNFELGGFLDSNSGIREINPKVISQEVIQGIDFARIGSTLEPDNELRVNESDINNLNLKDLVENIALDDSIEISRTPNECSGQIKSIAEEECQLTIRAANYIEDTNRLLIQYVLNPEFEDNIQITTNPEIADLVPEINTDANIISLDLSSFSGDSLDIRIEIEGEADCAGSVRVNFPEKICRLQLLEPDLENNRIVYVIANANLFEDQIKVESNPEVEAIINTNTNTIEFAELSNNQEIRVFVEGEDGCEDSVRITENEPLECELFEKISPLGTFDFREVDRISFESTPNNYFGEYNVNVNSNGRSNSSVIRSKSISRNVLNTINNNTLLAGDAVVTITDTEFPNCNVRFEGTKSETPCESLKILNTSGEEISEIPTGSSFIKFEATPDEERYFLNSSSRGGSATVTAVGGSRILDTNSTAFINTGSADEIIFTASGAENSSCQARLTVIDEEASTNIETRISKRANKTRISQNDQIDYFVNFTVDIKEISEDDLGSDTITFTLLDVLNAPSTINQYLNLRVNGTQMNPNELEEGLEIEVPAEENTHNFEIQYSVKFEALPQFIAQCQNSNRNNSDCGESIVNTITVLETGVSSNHEAFMLCPYLITRSFGEILFNSQPNLNTIDLNKCTNIPNTQSAIKLQEEPDEKLPSTGGEGLQAPSERVCYTEGEDTISNLSSAVCETTSQQSFQNELALENVKKQLIFSLNKYRNIDNAQNNLVLSNLDSAIEQNPTAEKNVFRTDENLNISGTYEGPDAITIIAEKDITINSNISATNAPITIVSLNGNIIIDQSVDVIEASLVTLDDDGQIKLNEEKEDGGLVIKGSLIGSIKDLYENIKFSGNINENVGRLTVIYDGRVQFMPPPGFEDPSSFDVRLR